MKVINKNTYLLQLKDIREKLLELKNFTEGLIKDAIKEDSVNFKKLTSDIIADTLVQIICDYYLIKKRDMTDENRKQPIPKARHIFFKIMKELSDSGKIEQISLGIIGSYLNKDHATVLHGIKNINEATEINDLLNKGHLRSLSNDNESKDLYYDYIEISNLLENNIVFSEYFK